MCKEPGAYRQKMQHKQSRTPMQKENGWGIPAGLADSDAYTPPIPFRNGRGIADNSFILRTNAPPIYVKNSMLAYMSRKGTAVESFVPNCLLNDLF